MNMLPIEFVQGDQGPHYTDTIELALERCVVTEKGTQGGLPIVDFVMKGPAGQKYMFCVTGRMMTMLAAAIKGVNVRNHGVAEP